MRRHGVCARSDRAGRVASGRMTPGSDDATVAGLAISLLDLTDLGRRRHDRRRRRSRCAPGPRRRCGCGVRVAAVRGRCAEALPTARCGWPPWSTSRPATSRSTPCSTRRASRARRRGRRDRRRPAVPRVARRRPRPRRRDVLLRRGRRRRAAHPGALVKVIIESGELPDRAAVDRAAHFAIDHGARFVKTSTGKTPVSATLDAAETILEAIAVSGEPVGLKASGGIRTLDRRPPLPRPGRPHHGPGLDRPPTRSASAPARCSTRWRRARSARSTGPASTPCCSTSTACSRRPPRSTNGPGRRCSTASSTAGPRPTGTPFVPFSADDYLAYVDGKPRFDGVRSFVAVAGDRPAGGQAPTTRPATTTISALGNAKNAAFQQVLRTDGIAAYPGSLRAARRARRAGHRGGRRVVVAQRRRGARRVGLAPRFDVVVDGSVAGAEDLAGKPAPDMFLAAADRLGVPRRPGRGGRGRPVRRRRRPGRRLRPRCVGVDRGAGHAMPLLATGRRRRRRATSPNCVPDTRPARSHRDAARRCRLAAPAPLPGRRVALRRARFEPADAPPHRDAVRRRQRLPRPARRPRGGPRRRRPGHVRQRLPRDVEHPPRRGGVRLRHDRPDDRQRARPQDPHASTSTTSRSTSRLADLDSYERVLDLRTGTVDARPRRGARSAGKRMQHPHAAPGVARPPPRRGHPLRDDDAARVGPGAS